MLFRGRWWQELIGLVCALDFASGRPICGAVSVTFASAVLLGIEHDVVDVRRPQDRVAAILVGMLFPVGRTECLERCVELLAGRGIVVGCVCWSETPELVEESCIAGTAQCNIGFAGLQ